MCDSLYASSPGSKEPAFFAKNSYRHSSEPQAPCLVPRRPAQPAIEVGGKALVAEDRAALDGARSRVAEALRGWEAHLGTLADSPSS